jgi:hypothetical protein
MMGCGDTDYGYYTVFKDLNQLSFVIFETKAGLDPASGTSYSLWVL